MKLSQLARQVADKLGEDWSVHPHRAVLLKADTPVAIDLIVAGPGKVMCVSHCPDGGDIRSTLPVFGVDQFVDQLCRDVLPGYLEHLGLDPNNENFAFRAARATADRMNQAAAGAGERSVIAALLGPGTMIRRDRRVISPHRGDGPQAVFEVPDGGARSVTFFEVDAVQARQLAELYASWRHTN